MVSNKLLGWVTIAATAALLSNAAAIDTCEPQKSVTVTVTNVVSSVVTVTATASGSSIGVCPKSDGACTKSSLAALSSSLASQSSSSTSQSSVAQSSAPGASSSSSSSAPGPTSAAEQPKGNLPVTTLYSTSAITTTVCNKPDSPCKTITTTTTIPTTVISGTPSGQASSQASFNSEVAGGATSQIAGTSSAPAAGSSPVASGSAPAASGTMAASGSSSQCLPKNSTAGASSAAGATSAGVVPSGALSPNPVDGDKSVSQDKGNTPAKSTNGSGSAPAQTTNAASTPKPSNGGNGGNGGNGSGSSAQKTPEAGTKPAIISQGSPTGVVSKSSKVDNNFKPTKISNSVAYTCKNPPPVSSAKGDKGEDKDVAKENVIYAPSDYGKVSVDCSIIVSEVVHKTVFIDGPAATGAPGAPGNYTGAPGGGNGGKSNSTLPVAKPSAYYEDGDILGAISTKEPASLFKRKDNSATHDVSHVLSKNDKKCIHTNKFYENAIVGKQSEALYAQPYTVWWNKADKDSGLAVSYFANGRQFGETGKYFYHTLRKSSLTLSAKEFSKDTTKMQVVDPDTHSATIRLYNGNNGVDFPLVLGMGFVSGKYNGVTPRVLAPAGITKIERAQATNSEKSDAQRVTERYEAKLVSGEDWVIYVTKNKGDDFELTWGENGKNGTSSSVLTSAAPSATPSFAPKNVSSSAIKAATPSANSTAPSATGKSPKEGDKPLLFLEGSGVAKDVLVQVAILKEGIDAEKVHGGAGMYVTGVDLKASVKSNKAQYSLAYRTEGSSLSGKPLIFALQHHVASFVNDLQNVFVGKLESTVKGAMQGYLTSSLDMQEDLHPELGMFPVDLKNLKPSQLDLKSIAEALNVEMTQDYNRAVPGGQEKFSYWHGKVIDKFAYMTLVANDVIQQKNVTETLLNRTTAALDVWTQNKQDIPFIYDTKYCGITAEKGSIELDFGFAQYNSHHFHYGYFVHAAAIVGYVDKQLGGNWLEKNKDWVTDIIRSTANPSKQDTYFPVFRTFDFFHGHSWASGLFELDDGRNAQSSSEDVNFAYAMKIWGSVIGDKKMEARGDLMLSILSRSLNSYFLLKSDNQIIPKNMVERKVVGITWENKLAYETFFGHNTEWIHGIQMLPITAASLVTRFKDFCKEEWSSMLQNHVGNVKDGYRGILHANQALFDAKSSYEFFSKVDLKTQNSYIDSGSSLAWYLTFAGMLNAGEEKK